MSYDHDAGFMEYNLPQPLVTMPPYVNTGYYGWKSWVEGVIGGRQRWLTYDQACNFNPLNVDGNGTSCFHDGLGWGSMYEYAGQCAQNNTSYQLTTDPNNTMIFGKIYDTSTFMSQYDIMYPEFLMDYPTCLLGGNVYGMLCDLVYYGNMVLPAKLYEGQAEIFRTFFGGTRQVTKVNLSSIPFNLMLTSDYQSAVNYLNGGSVPFDAKLYPLDWDNLPTYDVPINTIPDPDDPEPDDNPDNINPGDAEWDIDNDDDTDPTTSVKNLCNYNLYWLQAPQWEDFVRWFWNDISAWNGFSDLINSIQGLYNDLASAVIMCRYMPIDISWVGGLGADENIKLGMIEKTGVVNTISKNNVENRVLIGEITIDQKMTDTFIDYSPYSQLSLYLPLHGFLDIDVDIFTYNTIRVEGIYDVLSGTLQYLIWCKHGNKKMLVNTVECKIAQDIPLTLQTKNDRDSMVFSNVSSTIGGLVGAGVSIASGNPIGMTMGVQNGVSTIANSGSASAPMRVMGTTGELGGRFAPAYCKIILRHPTIQPSDVAKDGDSNSTKLKTWRKNVGQLCGYGYTLEKLKGKGFTACASPRITFENSAPLQNEVDEIYSYLEKGVIL